MHVTQILFRHENGDVLATPPAGQLQPVVRIAYPHSLETTPEGTRFSWGGDERRKSLALIDTGADNCLVDSGLADHLNLTNSSGRVVSARGVTGTRETYDVDTQIFLIDSRHAVKVPAFKADFSGQPYSFLLGMSFLRTGVLTLDFQRGIFQFEFFGNAAGGSDIR